MSRRILQSMALAAACLFSASAFAADAAPDDAIKYRKNVMGAVGSHTSAISAILKGEVDFKDSLPVHVNGLAIAANAAVITEAFRQNTDGEGSENTTATARVWSDWDRFQQAAEELEAAVQEVSAAAENGTLTSFDQMRPVFEKCGFCHRQAGYRE